MMAEVVLWNTTYTKQAATPASTSLAGLKSRMLRRPQKSAGQRPARQGRCTALERVRAHAAPLGAGLVRVNVAGELSKTVFGSSGARGAFQERWTVASGKNRLSGESGKTMKP